MAKTVDEILRELTPIFREVFDDDSLIPSAGMVAADVAEWDSLGHIRLVVAVEQHFGLEFTTAEIAGWPNVGAFAEAIRGKLT